MLCRNENNKKTALHKAKRIIVSGAACANPLMGEEKPDEELMGKRKSSPRLSTTLFGCRYLQYSRFGNRYTCPGKIFVVFLQNMLR